MDEKIFNSSLLNFRDVTSARLLEAQQLSPRVGVNSQVTIAISWLLIIRSDEASQVDRKYLRESLGITSLIKLWGPPESFVRRKDDASQYQEQYPDKIRSFQVLDLNIHEISLYSSTYRANLSNSLSRKDKARGSGWFLVGQMNNLKAVCESAFERETGWLKNIADFLALSKPQIKAVFEALAQEEVCPVLIYGPHTSLILCLLLSLQGVAEDKISREYLLTEQNSDALPKYDNAYRKEFGLAAKTSYDHPQSFVPDVLDHINAEYRGVHVYLSSIGLTNNQLESVKKNLQEPANSNEKLVDVEEQYRFGEKYCRTSALVYTRASFSRYF
ncbi:hypothetical protein D0866_03033 [Hortaea werneckii]|uniref:Uncharacterized protein n=1 Tax=Hortaea werneckii TaxID=91943 RepID=A0A3M7BD95_HORWE|nr:hypothetical protein D0866_03033 [Hortaea werneckii]